MVYDCGCAVFSKPNRFMNSAEIRFFWLPLSMMNCSGKPFTHIWEWKICSSSFESSGSSFWIFMVATVALGSASIIFFPLSFPFSGSDSVSEYALIRKPLSHKIVTAWPGTHWCCEWGSYGTRTTFLLPSSASQCCSSLAALASCLESPCLGCVLGSTVWGHLSLASDSQNQSLAFPVSIFAQFW